ncbi:hypothetical protein AAC387_Pa08g2182 [Persea americana]
MASTFVSAAEQCKEHGKNPSFGKLKRSWSSNESSCSAGQGIKTCVCAPATHAGSFKCRLHRVNSHGHSSPPPPPRPAASNSTVEAQ